MLLGLLVMVQVNAQAQFENSQCVTFRKVDKGIKGDKGIKRSPYHGDLVTSSCDYGMMQLSLWFHYKAENVEVIITNDGMTVAEETFDMDANEVLECDFSECGSGAYTVCVVVDGVVHVVGTFNVVS